MPVVFAATGLTALEVLGYVGTVGTFGYMLAYALVSLAAPAFLRRTAAAWTTAAIVGVLGAAGMAYVFYRSIWPRPAAPYDVLPFVFLALMVPAVVRYAVVRRRPTVISLNTPPATPAPAAAAEPATAPVVP